MRMGWVASFIPASVMRGFIEGLVYVTIIGQVPHLLGISGASGNFFTKLWHILQHLPDVSLAPALTGILCLMAMLLFRYLAPAIPAALIVLAGATILIGLLGGEATGVHVAGHIPSGLPHLTLPNLDATIWYELAPGALAMCGPDMRRHSAQQRRLLFRAVATSIRTRNWSHTDRQTS